jgi:DNA primase
LTGQTAKTFRLGYAPSGSGLLHELKAKGCDLKQCQKLGLLAFNQTRQQFYDYFYDRVMFPIFDRKKRVIGFSGRMLEKGEPKYLNSPETDLFHKGEQLFGLPFAIETIRMKNEAIVVEGNMDVISLHQHGWNQTVAPLGTAFTEKQVQILWKLCDEPIMCFDGDSAGQRAMIRAMNRALPLLVPGKSLRFAVLPPGMDPDDMMRQKSDKIWKNLIQNAQSFIDVFWADLLATHLYSTPHKRVVAFYHVVGFHFRHK